MALRSGYKGFKKLLPGLKILRPGTLGIDNDVLIPELNKTFFPRSEQAVLGAKNWFDFNSITAGGANCSGTADAIRIHGTDEWVTTQFTLNVRKNTDYKLDVDVDYTSGVGYFSVYDSTGTTGLGGSGQITQDGSKSLKFNTGNFDKIRITLFATYGTNVEGDVTYNNLMLKLANDPDPTYQPYAMTNKELTEKLTDVSDTITSTFTLNNDGTDLVKNGNIVHFIVRIDSLTATDGNTIATLPIGFRPSKSNWFNGMNVNDGSSFSCYVGNDGKLVIRKTLSNANIRITGTFVI